ETLYTGAGFRTRHRFFDRGVLPDDLTGTAVECHDAAAECAARVIVGGADTLLADALYRYEQASVVQGRRAGNACNTVVVDFALPEQGARVSVECVNVGALVADVDGIAALAIRRFVGTYRRCGAYGGVRHVGPVGAACVGVQ